MVLTENEKQVIIVLQIIAEHGHDAEVRLTKTVDFKESEVTKNIVIG